MRASMQQQIIKPCILFVIIPASEPALFLPRFSVQPLNLIIMAALKILWLRALIRYEQLELVLTRAWFLEFLDWQTDPLPVPVMGIIMEAISARYLTVAQVLQMKDLELTVMRWLLAIQ